jgi:hypothetical protein
MSISKLFSSLVLYSLRMSDTPVVKCHSQDLKTGGNFLVKCNGEGLKTIFEPEFGYEGRDDHRHRVFLSTNEIGLNATFSHIRKEPVVGDTFIGTSSFFNLNAFSVRSQAPGRTLKYLVVVDCSLRVEKFWKEFAQKMASSVNTIDEAQDVVYDIMNENAEFFFRPSRQIIFFGATPLEQASMSYEKFIKEIRQGLTWLSCKKRFSIILELFRQHHFFFVRADLSDPIAMKKLQRRLVEGSMHLDTLYLSNVREYVNDDGRIASFQNTMKSFVSPETLIIDTNIRESLYSLKPLVQRVGRLGNTSVTRYFPSSSNSPDLISRIISICRFSFFQYSADLKTFVKRSYFVYRHVLKELISQIRRVWSFNFP